MSTSPFVCAFALTAASLLTALGSANATVANPKTAGMSAHLDSLHLAAHELKHAHAALGGKGGKTGNPHTHLSAAIGHIEQAIKQHASSQNQNKSGLSGALNTAVHHHHHGQLHEALHAAKEAEKHLANGDTTRAKHETEKSHHHVELAMHGIAGTNKDK